MCISAVLGGSALLSAGIGIVQGNKAAKAQKGAAADSLALQQQMFEQTRADLSPFVGAGSNALAAMEFDLGLRQNAPSLTPDIERPEVTRGADFFTVGGKEFDSRPEARKYLRQALKGSGFGGDIANAMNPLSIERQDGGFMVNDRRFDTERAANRAADRRFEKKGGQFYEGYETSPGYEFRLQEGVDAIDASAAARGGLFSGSTLKRAQQFGQDYATNDYANHLQRLFGVAGMGQNAAAQTGSLGANFAAQGSNALTSAGNASAFGAVNTANQLNNFLSGATGAFGASAGSGGGFNPSAFPVQRTGTGMLF